MVKHIRLVGGKRAMLRFLLSLCVGGLIPIAVRGEIPLQINHQGLVKVNGLAFNGNGDFRFALVDPDTGDNLWTNDGTNVPGPGTPTNAVNLAVINGIYNVRLGDTTLPNMTSVPSTVFNDDNVVLRIWFDDTQGNGVEQLSPDHVLTSAPYAFRVYDGVTLSADQTITGAKSFTGVTSFDAVAQLVLASQVGDMFYHGPSGIERLAPGESGQVLSSRGPGLAPVWASSAAQPTAPVVSVAIYADSARMAWGEVANGSAAVRPYWKKISGFNTLRVRVGAHGGSLWGVQVHAAQDSSHYATFENITEFGVWGVAEGTIDVSDLANDTWHQIRILGYTSQGNWLGVTLQCSLEP